MAGKDKARLIRQVKSTVIDIGQINLANWRSLKSRLHFSSDPDFVEYLLQLAEKHHSSASDNCKKDTRDGKGGSGVIRNTVQTSAKVIDEYVATVPKELEELRPGREETLEMAAEPSEDVTDPSPGEPQTVTATRQDENSDIANESEITDSSRDDSSCEDYKTSRKKKFRAIDMRKARDDERDEKDTEILKKCLGERKVAGNSVIQTKSDELTEKSTSVPSKSCPYCDGAHTNSTCPLDQPLSIICDSFYNPIESQEDLSKSSLPNVLEIGEKTGKESWGVFAKSSIPKYTQFGPLIGSPIKEMEIPDDASMQHIWEVCEGTYISTSDPNRSNWIRWLCPAPTRHDRNVVPLQRDGKLFFVTTAPINSGSELLYWAEMTGPWASKKMLRTSCGGCNLQFDHPMYYRTHCAVFHEASLSLTVRKYHCKICGKAVLGKQNIMKHALLNHEGKGAYQCQFCSKFFLRLNYLEMHRNYGCSANPHRARPLCHYCGRKFCQPQKLKVHIKRMHSDLTEVLHEFQCRDCLKILGSTAALQRHTKEVHKRPSSVSCSKCAKTFQNKSNLKIHMLTHSGVKPFQCQEDRCSAAFTTKQCLQFHYKKVHGLTEDRFPSIVRSVEYTFESYAGEKDDASLEDREDPTPLESDADKENDNEAVRRKEYQNAASPAEPIYEERSVIEYHCSTALTKNHKSRPPDFFHSTRDSMTGVIMSGQTASASSLVEAALESAEREIRRPLQAPSPTVLPGSPMEPPLAESPPPQMMIPSPPPPVTMEQGVMGASSDRLELMQSSQEESRRSPPHYVSVMYDPMRPCTPPMCSPRHVTYLSPRYERHYLSPPPPREFIHEEHRYHEEDIAQNLTKYKYEEARAMYHELIPRYHMASADYSAYPWEVFRPAINLPTSVDLSVSTGHLPPPIERPPSPPYQPFHVPQKPSLYHHYTTYY